jgi:hypothetical protein
VPNIHPSPWPSTASFPGCSINVQYNNSKQGCLHTAASNDRFLFGKYFRSYLASKSNIYIYLLLTAAAVVAFGHTTTAMTYVTTNTHIEPNNIQTEHATTQPDDVVTENSSPPRLLKEKSTKKGRTALLQPQNLIWTRKAISLIHPGTFPQRSDWTHRPVRHSF